MKKVIQPIILIALSCFFAANTQAATPEAPPAVAKPAPSYTIQITSPKANDVLQNDTQELHVSVSISPNLESEDKVEILVDGHQSGTPVQGTSIQVPALERGSHTLQAKIIQPKGKGATSDSITVTQQRASKLSPN